MKILSIISILSPSKYYSKPSLVMTLDIEGLNEKNIFDFPELSGRLFTLLPRLKWVMRKKEPNELNMAVLVGLVSLEISRLVGIDGRYSRAIYNGSDGIYKIVLGCKSEEAMRQICSMAVEMVTSLIAGEAFPLQKKIDQIKNLITETHRALNGRDSIPGDRESWQWSPFVYAKLLVESGMA